MVRELVTALAAVGEVDAGGLLDLAPIANLGLAGLAIVAFLRGWIVRGQSLADSVAERRAVEARLEQLQAALRDQLLPAVLASTALVEQQRVLLEQHRSDGRETAASLARISELLAWLGAELQHQRQALEHLGGPR